MLLAIDIGNTNINFGIYKGNRLLRKFSLPTAAYSYKKIKAALCRLMPVDIAICSVVPEITRVLARDLSRLNGKQPYIIGKDLRAPIKNLYRHPAQVGQDRLVNAYAGALLYGVPLITVDFGTAVTIDVISKKKEYLGGMILPGLNLSLNTLFEHTALLPKIRLSEPKEFIGKDTKNSMLSGIVYGFAALVDDLSSRIKNKIGQNARVIGTGGDINLVLEYCKSFDIINKDLTLKGINLIYQNRTAK